ncbi:hypothetical protein NDA01_30965 [Trichocoleus desertorum AS-A10]|uniref:hypothetical protein n=1 Tax=Trichocoleus desertorum TaxID=1481672 RepID=UPI003297C463
MWQWLNSWQRAISRGKPAIEEAPPPATLTHPAPRTAVAPALSHPLAVDLPESSLFYRSIEGKLICRSIASGDIVWESQDDGYPLCVTDDILWVVQGDAIAAYVTTNGRLLMRSPPLWLTGTVTHMLCDLSQQTLRIYSTYSPPPPNLGTPHYLPPPAEDEAAYEISLITGEIIPLYQVTLYHKSKFQLLDRNGAFEPRYNIVPRVPEAPSKQMKGQLIAEQRQRFEELRSERQKAYARRPGQSYEKAQLQATSVVICEYGTDQGFVRKTILSVFPNQTPDVGQWEALLKEFCIESPTC